MLYYYLWIQNWLKREEGQDVIEYALLLGLIAIVAVVAITASGQAINGVWQRVQAALQAIP